MDADTGRKEASSGRFQDYGADIVFDAVAYGPPGHPAIVSDITWAVKAGSFQCLIGRSGCGKTTLLKLAAGLLSATRGEVRLSGSTLKNPASSIGFVFQAPTLLTWLTALNNVLLPISLRGKVEVADRNRARDLLVRLGLAGLENRLPLQLSGGQQARVALARALIDTPKLLLLDEPFAALDALTREELQLDLARLASESGATVLLVTHDISEAVYLADEIAVMGTGKITAQITTALPRIRPTNIRYEGHFNELCRTVRAELDRAS